VNSITQLRQKKPHVLENNELIKNIHFRPADIDYAGYGGKYNLSGPILMLKKLKTIFNYFLLILLGAALIACGKYVQSKNSARTQQNQAQKLAAAKASTSSSRRRPTSRNTRRTTTRRTTRSGST
jgi:hypothetical protein